jgi:tetratricopeptide (TPR) repeat protein
MVRAMTSSMNALRHVEYAMGYLSLGLIDQAALELDAIESQDRFCPEVLAARMELSLQKDDWNSLVELGAELAPRQPQSDRAWLIWAYALRALERFDEACSVLRRAARWHGEDNAILHYHLACYCALAGNYPAARDHLRLACAIDPKIRSEALNDPDLAAVCSETVAAA